MVVWVVQFLREGYKIRILAKNKHSSKKLSYLVNLHKDDLSKNKHYFREKSASKIEVIKSVDWKNNYCKFIYLVQCKKSKGFGQLLTEKSNLGTFQHLPTTSIHKIQ